MEYFKYSKNSRSAKELVDIFTAVHNLDRYAKSIYSSRWEDVLDRAFFHIAKNYDSSKGNLENYAIRVIRGIGLNDYKKECPTEFIEDLNIDAGYTEKESEEPTNSSVEVELFYLDENEESASEDIEGCIRFLVPYYIKDYALFKSMDGSKRKEDYRLLFKSYGAHEIQEAINYLNEKYSKELDEFYELRKKCVSRKAGRDKVEKSLDSTLKFMQTLNGVIFYKRKVNRSETRKYFYQVDIDDIVTQIVHDYYLYSKGSVEVEGVRAYLSLRGEILFDLDEAIDLLKVDIYTFILTASKLKVLMGDDIYLVGTKEVNSSVAVKIFGDVLQVHLMNKTAKEVKERNRVVQVGGTQC